MKLTVNTGAFRTAKPVLALFVIAFSACVATGQPALFDEDFAGPFLTDPAWTEGGFLGGHPTVIAGTYDMTTGGRGGGFNPKLSRSTAGTLSEYTHEIEVTLDPFLLDATPGTGSDFKWKTFGPDGFMEVVFNSFGDMRLFHNDFTGGAGNLQPNTKIDYMDGDLLKLTTAYDLGTDTIDVRYSLNGGPTVPFYSGGGIDGRIGDLITNFIEVELFKFNDANPDNIIAKIDSWSLVDTITMPENSGDYNGNGVVDAADYTTWRNSRGQTVAPGTGADGNSDGTVDALDYDYWKVRFGTTIPAAAAGAPVPEPGACALLIGSLILLASANRIR